MYFNHSLAGAVAVKPIIDKFENVFTEREKTTLWFVGVTASVLPDFDLVYAVLNKLANHRSFVTHGIFLYLIIFTLLWFLSYFQKKDVFGRKFFKVLALVFIVGVLTHFIIDILIGGVVLLAPFSYRVMGFDMVFRREGTNWLMIYLGSRYMIIEFLVALLFFSVIKGKKYIVAKFFALFYFLSALAAFVFISLSFF